MEIKITTTQVLKVLQVLSWVLFIGLCIEAGGILFNACYASFFNPKVSAHFWGMDLSGLYAADRGAFIGISLIMIIVAVLKAVMFYLIVKLFTEKGLDLAQPFSPVLKRFIVHLSALAAGIGLFSFYGQWQYSMHLTRSIGMPDKLDLHFAGADVWLFMAVILFVIAQIVKRGIDIQQENDLTI